MEKIIVSVDWCGKNYAAYICDERIGGVVLATGKLSRICKKTLKRVFAPRLKVVFWTMTPYPKPFNEANTHLNMRKE